MLTASLFPHMPSSSVSSPGENLDHFGRTTTTPFASLPPWRRCPVSSCRWWSFSLLEEDPLLHLPLLKFSLHRPSRVGRRLADALPPFSSLADTLPLGFTSGCFAAAVAGRSCLRTDALPLLLVGRVDALPPFSVYLGRCSSFCRFSCVVSARIMGSGVACCCYVLSLCFFSFV